MRRKWMIAGLAILAVIAVGSVVMAGNNERSAATTEREEGEQVFTLDQVPAAVAATIRAQAGSATIGKIDLNDEDGADVFGFECVANGVTKEGTVARDGRFLGWEAADDASEANEPKEAEEADEDEADEPSLTLAQVTAAVAATIRAQAGSATIKEISLNDEDGRQVYGFDIVANGAEKEGKVAPDGRFLGWEAADDQNEANDKEGDEDGAEEHGENR